MDIIGLALSFTGAIIIFFFGLHPMISESGAIHLIAEQVDKGEIRRAKRYRAISRIGLILLVVGFQLQLIERFI